MTMDKNEVVEILKPLFEQCKGINGCLGYIEHFFTKNEEEALDFVIKTLEEDRWILLSERWPEDREDIYWVCTDSGYQCQCRWTNVNPLSTNLRTDWHWCHFDIPQYQKVAAWRSLPNLPESLDYQRAVENAEYCERYEPTYSSDDGSM